MMPSSFDIPQTPRAKTRYREVEVAVGDDGDNIIDMTPMAGEGLRTGHKFDNIPLEPGTLPPRYTPSPFSEHGGRLSPARFVGGHPTGLPVAQTPNGIIAKVNSALRGFWARHFPVMLVLFGQFFGSLMNLFARLLEVDETHKMHPVQMLFIRMSLTMVIGSTIMYWRKTPHFPMGQKGVMLLLVVRGLTGFSGILCFWLSLMHLPMAEATVITFLVPGVSGYVCHLLLHDPFTRKEQIASFIALGGVILIARPASLFTHSAGDASTPAASPVDMPITNLTSIAIPEPSETAGNEVDSFQRLTAIGFGLLGVLGATGAFTSIRAIGKRADPLISVNYFATIVTVVTGAVMILAPILDIGQPDLRFDLPQGLQQWAFVLSITLCGFLMQFLLTSGLRAEKSNRATAMVYTQMLFAAGFDKWIFGQEMGAISLFGCGLIIGSALWVALTKKAPVEKPVDEEAGTGAEAIPMLDREIEDEEDEGAGLDVNHRLSGR